MAYCGNCGHLVDQFAQSSGQCTFCLARIAPNGDVLMTNQSSLSSDVSTRPDVDILFQGNAIPHLPLHRDLSQPLNRLGAGLGTTGGTLAAVAFFLAWIMFTSSSCSGSGPVVTQSGWDILTKPAGPFGEWLLMAPIFACAVASVVLQMSFLLAPSIHEARIAAWNFVLTLVGWGYFLLFIRQVVGNQVVHHLFAGFYFEVAGLALLFIGTVLQIVGTMPATQWKGKQMSRLASIGLCFALYPVAVFIVVFFAGLSTSPIRLFFPDAIGWFFIISCLLSSIASILAGRSVLTKMSNGIGTARWSMLVSIGELTTILYSAGLFVAVLLISHISKGH